MGSIFIKLNFQQDFNSEFNQETGISTVTFHNHYGKFTGIARLNPEDEASKFAGCHIAEARANIAYYKTALRYAKDRVKIIKAAYEQEPTNILGGMLKDTERIAAQLKEKLKNEQAYLANYIASLGKQRNLREVMLANFAAGQN